MLAYAHAPCECIVERVRAYEQARDEKGKPMLLSTKQAAQRLCVAPATIRRWSASGRVRYVRIGRERAIPAVEVNRLRRARRKKAQTALGCPSLLLRSEGEATTR